MTILMIGGSKSGKTSLALKLAKALQDGGPLYYVATMQAGDEEDEIRIQRHIQERSGFGFTTLEQPADISLCLNQCDRKGCFLIDSITALLANEMFGQGAIRKDAFKKTAAELLSVCGSVKHIVVVSDYIYADAIKYDENSEIYKKGLAAIHRRLAEGCDIVLEASCGLPMVYKGRGEFQKLYEKIR